MNSVNTGWNDEDFSTIEKDLIKSQGIVDENADGSDLVVEENTPQQMNVLVNSGVAYVHITKNGRDWWVRVANDAQAQVTVSPNVSGSTRIDALVLRVSVSTEPNASATNVATLAMVQGTPGGAAPSDGDITTALGSDGWVRLANITVDNGVGQIFTADIEDTRAGVEFGIDNAVPRITYKGDGSQLYGVVHSPVDADLLPGTDNAYDIGSLIKRFQDAFFSGTVTANLFSGDASGLTGINTEKLSVNTLYCGETLADRDLVYIRNGFFPDYDTYVDQSNAATNYDTNNSIYAGRYAGSTTKRRALIKLPIGNLGASITTAKLRLYVKTKNGANSTLYVHRNTADYTSGTVTYNTMPAYDAVASATYSVTATGWIEIDITTLMNQWLAGTYSNYGVTLVYGDELSDAINVEFYTKDDSSNYDYQPRLIINNTSVLFKASASYTGERSVVEGCMDEAGSKGQKKRYLITGFKTGFSISADINTQLYLSNAGAAATTPGTQVRKVGVLVKTDTVKFDLAKPKVYVGSPGLTTTGVSNVSRDLTVTVDVGFTPRFFKGIVTLEQTTASDFSYGSNAHSGTQGIHIEGIVGGAVVWHKQQHSSSYVPNNSEPMSPYGAADYNGGTYGKPTYGSGTSVSIGTGTINCSLYTDTIQLYSVTVSGTSLIFTFRYTYGNSPSGVSLRYGVKSLVVWE